MIERTGGQGNWVVSASDGGEGSAASLATALRAALGEPSSRSLVASDEARQSAWIEKTAAKIEADAEHDPST
jgi:hypothetical protein